MNRIFVVLFFSLTLSSIAQQQEFFNFTDTVFKINTIKRVPSIYPYCMADYSGSYLNEEDQKSVDSIVKFLATHKTMVLELGVKEQTVKRDKKKAAYFKSCIVDRGGDSTRILVAGYGRKYQLYSRKEIIKAKKENTGEGWYKADKMVHANYCFELKILQY